MSQYVFTSECVTMGHPDKVADQVSDGILDAIMAEDSNGRVACETLVTTGLIVMAGEITTKSHIDYPPIARRVVEEIGYNDSAMGFDHRSCAVLVSFHQQSPDIAMGVDEAKDKEQGAGDQGMMFGYACNDTEDLMPLPIALARKLANRLAEVRQTKALPFIRPDGKTQVTVLYENNKPVFIPAVVVSTQHTPEVKQNVLRAEVIEKVVKSVIPAHFLSQKTVYHINPTGRFEIGGPHGDCGLTGRKIIVDTYGGMGRHGGGAFSGKDASKVDRSACYMMRHVAKNIVAAGLADRCEVQVAYAIGVAEPVSFKVDTFNTGKVSEEKLIELIRGNFPLKPRQITEYLDLKKPIYLNTARYGHFGGDATNRPWERTNKAEILRKQSGI